VILCAETLSDESWRRLLDSPECRLVVVSRTADARLWAEALNLGVFDVLPDAFTVTELEWTLISAHLDGAGNFLRRATHDGGE
jgi:hypothetical protein